MKVQRLNTAEAAEYMACSVSLLTKMRVTGKGPRYYKRGGTVFYLAADLDDYDKGFIVETSDSRRSAQP